MSQRVINAARILVNDILAMQNKNDSDWFGEFSSEEAPLGGVNIEWPNLAISLESLQRALMELDNEPEK
jgi:hypothetical protein